MLSSKGGFTADEAETQSEAPPSPPRLVDRSRFYDPLYHRQMALRQQGILQKRMFLQQLHQHHLYQLQQQLRLHNTTIAEAETPADANDHPITPPLPASPSPTNLDRFMEAVAPSVQARYLSEVDEKDGVNSFFYLSDLWECFNEWSVYGAGVPFLLNGKDSIEQYYIPSLSGIQLYIDSSLQSSQAGVKERKSFEGDTRGNSGTKNPIGSLLFEFKEYDRPYNRKPLTDKVSLLAAEFPELNSFRSCDLLPTSWFSIAWYPIYRIPLGPTLQDLEASFLTFHSLSTQSKCIVNSSTEISLPVFGLASYKLKGSIISPGEGEESEQEKSLLQGAATWLQYLGVFLPDYQFFQNHNIHRAQMKK